MNNFKTVSDSDLLVKTKNLARQERELLTHILHHLAEVDSRKLYLVVGYGSLWDYCVHELSYSQAAAGRRIAAMRLLKEMPSLEKPIEEGALNLSTLSTVQSFFKQEFLNKKTYSYEEKLSLIRKVEGKSTRDCMEMLAEISPQSVVVPEKVKPVSASESQITITVSKEFLEDVEELKYLISHELNQGTLSEVLSVGTRKLLNSLKKRKGMTGEKKITEPGTSQSAADSNAKLKNIHPAGSCGASAKNKYYGPAAMRAVWKRADSICEYEDPHTKKRCTSRWKLEVDHRIPHFLGGSNQLENLRLLCQQHHRRFTAEAMGGLILAAKSAYH